MESRVKTLNSDIGDYEQTHQNDTQNMNSMLESIRSILIARTGSPAVSVTNYQAGSIAKLPAYQRLQMGYEASGNYVAQNMEQYEEAIKKFEDKMNDKLADDRKAEGLKQLLSGMLSVTVGTALIFATAGAAAPIVFGVSVVGGTSTFYGLSNATEGMKNISLGFSSDGFTVAENPIRDTLFAGNPELYYTIGNASTMISAMALPMSGILKGATGATKFKAIAVDGGRILIGNVAEDKVYDAIYQSTDSRILAMLGSNMVEGVLLGNPANSSVSEVGDVARKTDIIKQASNKVDNLSNYITEEIRKADNFTTLRKVTAEEINSWWKNVMGYDNPPYKPGTIVKEIELTKDSTFVRVYDGEVSGMYGGWVMKAEDIAGLTPKQIQDKFALPSVPIYVVDVKLTKGTTIRTEIVNPLEGWGNGGGVEEMNNVIKINKNELCIDKKIMEFKYDIRDAKVLDNQIIVLLSIPFNVDEIDNIYAVSLDCKINWKVESLSIINPNGNNLPYESMFFNNGELTATDFYGRRYFINITDGTIEKRDIVK